MCCEPEVGVMNRRFRFENRIMHRAVRITVFCLVALLFAALLSSWNIGLPNAFDPGTVISSAAVNSNFTAVYNVINGGIDNAILASDAASLAKVSGGLMTISGSNVGIGTTAPNQQLAVEGSDGTTYIKVTDTSANGIAGLLIYNDAQAWAARIRGDVSDAFEFWDITIALYPFRIEVGAPTYTLYLDSTGNVGIGTATPDAKLDIKASNASIVLDGTTWAGINIQIGSANTAQFGNDATNTYLDYLGNMYFRAGFGGSTIMTFAPSGRVGIGTTSPSTKLHVAEPAATTTGSEILISHANNSSTNASARVCLVTGGSSGGDPAIQMTVNGATDWSFGVDNSDSDKFKLSKSYVLGTSDYFTVDTSGNAWFVNNVSALSFTDRTPYPKNLETAYAAVLSMNRLPDGEYSEDDKGHQVDHSTLHEFIKSDDGEHRDLSAVVSAQNEVIKDLLRRIEELEAKLDAME